MVAEYGTPLFVRKNTRPIKPTATVRVGVTYFTPKQIVYILNHPSARPTPEVPNPFVTIPPFILNIDRDPNNILFENLKTSYKSRRWKSKYVVAASGALIPTHLVAIMGPDDFERFGLDPDNLESAE
jgi:hypothetical protein